MEQIILEKVRKLHGNITLDIIKSTHITTFMILILAKEWKINYIFSILKKDTNNYNGMCVISTLNRLYVITIKKGKYKRVNELFTIQEIIQMKIQNKIKHIIFKYLTKVDVNVCRNKI